MYTLDANGKRLYTLNKVRSFLSFSTFLFTNAFVSLQVQAGEVTKSAHPARFSPDDKYSSKLPLLSAIARTGKSDRSDLVGHRVTLKKRYGLLLTQNSE